MKISRSRILFAAGLLAASFTLPVLSDPPADGGKTGGPPVGRDAEKSREGFGKDGKERMRANAERKNPEVWRKAFESVHSSLTEDQKAQTKALREEFEGKVKAWKEANGAKEKELMDKMRAAREQAGKQGGKPAEGQDGKKPERGAGVDPALIKQMQDLKATMPQPTEMQAKIWEILTPEQQATFKQNYENLQKEMEAKGGQRRRGPEGANDPMGDKAGEGGDRPARRPATGKPFQFEEGGDKPAQKKNGDGKPSGS